MVEKIRQYAKQTMLAQLNPYNTVDYVYLNAINKIENEENKYIGIKNVEQISVEFIQKMEKCGYIKHTIDTHSLGGRAIDMFRENPITGRKMTGSSSSTAMNVFLGVNDIGIGTDGGGSVLAPAMSLNLYAVISPKIDEKNMEKYQKISTDGILFSPSIGFITRNFEDLEKIFTKAVNVKKSNECEVKVHKVSNEMYDKSRQELICILKEKLEKYDIIETIEGPVDTDGFGDTIYGHFDESTKINQQKANKGLLKICNMTNSTAICIPQNKLGVSKLLISKNEDTDKLINYAKTQVVYEENITNKYFLNIDNYFNAGYGK